MTNTARVSFLAPAAHGDCDATCRAGGSKNGARAFTGLPRACRRSSGSRRSPRPSRRRRAASRSRRARRRTCRPSSGTTRGRWARRSPRARRRPRARRSLAAVIVDRRGLFPTWRRYTTVTHGGGGRPRTIPRGRRRVRARRRDAVARRRSRRGRSLVAVDSRDMVTTVRPSAVASSCCDPDSWTDATRRLTSRDDWMIGDEHTHTHTHRPTS